MKTSLLALALTGILAAPVPGLAAGNLKSVEIPDFTQGGGGFTGNKPGDHALGGPGAFSLPERPTATSPWQNQTQRD